MKEIRRVADRCGVTDEELDALISQLKDEIRRETYGEPEETVNERD